MAKQAIYQVRMDEEVRDQVETLYRRLGTTFAEAVRIFAVQSIREHGFPFTPSDTRGKTFGALASLADPSLISQEKTLTMMDESIRNMKAGKVSAAVDLSDFRD